MSDKQKVYLGVRVKTTVRELLQRERALRAALKSVHTISQGCLEVQDFCAPTVPGLDALQGADLFPVDAACCIHVQDGAFDNQQLMNMILPDESYNNNNNNNNNNNSSSNIASLPPPPSCELAWSQGHPSSNIDYYSHGMAPPSPADSLNLPSPVDHDSYSPRDSFSSSSSSCYSSPSRMEAGFHGFGPDHYHYPHCSLQHCYCAPPCAPHCAPPCWPGAPESFPAPDYAPYYGPTDYAYATPVEESYFKRELPVHSEMCYNVL